MKRISLFLCVGIIVLALAFIFSSCFIVHEGQRGVLASDHQNVLKPGLHYKWPWKSVNFITVNSEVSEFAIPLPAGGENLALAVAWHVADINAFAKANQTSSQILEILKTQSAQLIIPSFLANINSTQQLSIAILQRLQKNTIVQQKGISVTQVWVKGITPNAATQQKIFTNMKGLATTISQSIMSEGQAQAEQIRNTAEQKFIQAQKAVLNQAANILGQGNNQAVQTMAPLYRQNPALFKAYVAAKLKLLSSGTNS